MHTFEVLFGICESTFRQLLGIHGMKPVSPNTYKSFSYIQKGFSEIVLYVYHFVNKKTEVSAKHFFIMLRCNLGIIMGESKILALNLDDYTTAELAAGIQKRIYEVNELRCINLHEMPVSLWKTKRVDIALDIHFPNPGLLVSMLNRSFPYNRFNMKPPEGKRKIPAYESCYFKSASRRINIYRKLHEVESHGDVPAEERVMLDDLVRVEIQISKRGINNMKGLPPKDKRNFENFLNPAFVHGYLEKNAKNIFGVEKYVTTGAALKLVNESRYSKKSKATLCSVIKMIANYGSLYGLQKAIGDENIFTPADFGNKDKFNRLLKKIRELGINPATIPDGLARGNSFEVPSLYELLQKKRKIKLEV